MDSNLIIIGSFIVAIILIIIYKHFNQKRPNDDDDDSDNESDNEEQEEEFIQEQHRTHENQHMIPVASLPPKIVPPAKNSVVASLKSIDHVKDRFFITSWQGSTDYESLVNLGIKHIITASENTKPNYVLEEYELKGITNYQIPIEDVYNYDIKTPILEFEKIMDTIPSRDKVAVCCSDGNCRSPFLVAAYLERNNPDESIKNYFDYVRKKRRTVDINDSFINQFLREKLKEV